MRGNFDRLATGSGEAARQAQTTMAAATMAAATTGAVRGEGVAVLVSCIGRRLLMGQRVADEVEAAGAELDPRWARLGFYSYGELSPHAVSRRCELHNQTMTVTTLCEAA